MEYLLTSVLCAVRSCYPSHLQREKTVGRADRDSSGRASYSNDVFSWIGLSCLRHYFAQNLCFDNTHNGEDMGYEIVMTIQEGGDAYLNKPQLDGFHNLFPMSRKGTSVVEYKVNEMKEFIKTFVRVSLLWFLLDRPHSLTLYSAGSRQE